MSFSGIDAVGPVYSTAAQLNWTHVPGSMGYAVFDVTGADQKLVAVLPGAANQYTVRGLRSSTKFTYRVRLIDDEGYYDDNTKDETFSTRPQFDAETLANLVLWVDAADDSTITETDGLVSQWRDKSANGAHLRGAPGEEPTLTTDESRNAIYFGDGKRFLTGTNVVSGATGRTFAVALRPTSISKTMGNCALSLGGNKDPGQGYGFFIERPGDEVGLGIRVHGNKLINYETSTTTPTIFAVNVGDNANVTNINFRANGTDIVSPQTHEAADLDTESASGTVLGGHRDFVQEKSDIGYAFNGYIHELLVYDRQLSEDEIRQLEAYLADKWKIPLP